MKEIELKFLDINVEDILLRLEAYGAKKQFSQDVHDTLFEAEGYSPRGAKGFKTMRVRSIGEQVVITHKKPIPGKYKSVEETEILVQSSHEEAVQLITQLGFTRSREYHKHRQHFVAENAHFEIDEFEGLPAYLEVETTSEEMMKEVCEQFGLEISQGRPESAMFIYPEYFGR